MSIKEKSKLQAFGYGFLGIFLFLFGLSTFFGLHYFLTHLSEYSYSVRDPSSIFLGIVIISLILLLIGGSTIYYGIKIISKN